MEIKKKEFNKNVKQLEKKNSWMTSMANYSLIGGLLKC